MSDIWDWEKVVDPPAPKRSGRIKIRLIEKGEQMSNELKLWVLRNPEGVPVNWGQSISMVRSCDDWRGEPLFHSYRSLKSRYTEDGWTLKRETWVRKEKT